MHAHAQAASGEMSDTPRAIAKFAEAHALALQLADAEIAAAISSLMARCLSRAGRVSKALSYAYEAVREGSNRVSPYWTLAAMLEDAAKRRMEGSNPMSAAVLYGATANVCFLVVELFPESPFAESMRVRGPALLRQSVDLRSRARRPI